MNELLDKAIESVRSSKKSFCRFITANDVGETGSHQSGFYIPKDSWAVFFDSPGIRGQNKEIYIHIEWNDDFFTDSRAIYYGVGSRNEYRLTRFGKGFPFLEKRYSGSLLIIAKIDDRDYKAYVLDTDEDIDSFFSFFDISPLDNYHFIDADKRSNYELDINEVINNILSEYPYFPSTNLMSKLARDIHSKINKFKDRDVIIDPDKAITEWINSEYQLFRVLRRENLVKKRLTKYRVVKTSLISQVHC